MFTSRAEYRLLLRHDNADRRLTPLGRRVGLVNDTRWQRYTRKEEAIERLSDYLKRHRHQGDSLETWLRRTETTWEQMLSMHPALEAVAEHASAREQVILEAKYAGYIQRQATQVERFQQMEDRRIPASFDFHAVPQLRVEAREKFSKIRPTTLGQAGRISGINPTDLAVLMIYLD
jgi:tRNA uridine 5-carboxymethylaminomethyl modification enzyme